MNDLISRQAAIDALRYAQHRITVADEAYGMGTVKWSEDVIYFSAAEKVLTNLPSAQSEIVRCKDCKHGIYRPEMNAVECTLYRIENMRMNEHFCSYGERREE